MENLQKWGINLVRLGVMWEAVETSAGDYNATYLTEIKALVAKLGTYGIYTMLDAHQDVVSRSTCGEGFPDFYAKSLNSTCEDWSDPAFDDIKKVDTDCMSIQDYDYI
jgi:aryl-phospho-beta-D-glucosidase BglC (GH1 family)